jgi:hypothetical protein
VNSAFRKLLAVFFALWLPFSAVAAAMMPLCAHENAKQIYTAYAAEQGCGQHNGCPEQAGAEDDGTAAVECAQCGLCAFACTPWLPGAQSSIHAASSSAVIDGIFPALDSHVFPPADRPPLAAA